MPKRASTRQRRAPDDMHTARDMRRLIGRDVQWLTLGQAATYLGVAESTVRKWSAEGRLTAYSTPGGHRRFQTSDLDTFLEQSRVDTPAHEHRLVLIVDDDERTRAVVRFALEDDGYAVREASTVAAGLEALEEEPPDLIVLDVLMQNFDGVELLCQLRDKYDLQAVPLLIFAGRDSASPRRGPQPTAPGFVGAGASPASVVEAAKRLLGAPRPTVAAR